MKRLIKYTPILGYAMTRRDIESKLTSDSIEMRKHIIKLYLYPNHRAVNHWKGEVFDFVNNVGSLKGSHKYPKQSFIYEYLYKEVEDVLHRQIEQVWQKCEEDYGISIVPHDDNHIYIIKEIIKNYCMWLSEQLSNYGIVYPKDVYKKLDDLLNLNK